MPHPVPLSAFDGLRALEDCHKEQLDLCHLLEDLADALPSKIDTGAAAHIVTQLQSVLRRSHALEERTLFAMLQSAGPDVIDILDRLRQEHREDEDLAMDVRDSIRAYVKVRNRAEAEKLGYMLRCLFMSLRRHLAFDSDYVVPLARRMSGL